MATNDRAAQASEVERLINLLHETDVKLEALLGGEVDSVTNRAGRTILLRRAQRDLRRTEVARESAILAALPANIALLDANGVIVSVNKAWREFSEANSMVSAVHGVGMSYLAVCDRAEGEQSAHAADVARGIRGVLEGTEASYSIEYPCHSPTMQRCFLLQVVPLSDSFRKGAVVMHMDVSQRKRAEDTLRKSVAEFRALAETMQQIVWTSESDGTITYTNSHWLEYTGLAISRVMDAGWAAAIHPEDFPLLRASWHAAIENRTAAALEIRLRSVEGEFRWWLLRVAPLLDADGSVIKWLGTGTDIHGLKESNTQLERRVQERTAQLHLAREQAESATKAKSAFLATMSHEIRTPMNGVIGMIEVLQQSSLQHHQVEMTDLIRDSAFSLLQIIEDILDFSKIEAGQQQLLNEPFVLRHCVERVCGMLDNLAVKHGVRMTVFVDPALPHTVLADEGRLRQVLINLIGNAIKFSGGLEKAGTVSVRATPAREQPDSESVAVDFTVVDNGIGIEESTLASLFRPFAQADESTTRRYGGSGLGLAISDMLVRLMGGSISVQSTLGEGSTFAVHVQLKAMQAPPAAAARDGVSLEGMRCVIVGADAQLGNDIGAYLRDAGMRVERAADVSQVTHSAAERGISIRVVLPDSAAHAWTLHALSNASPDSAARLVVLGWGRRRVPRLEAPGLVIIDVDSLSQAMLLDAVAVACGQLPAESQPQPAPGSSRETDSSELAEQARRDGPLILVAEDNQTNRLVILKQLALLGFAADVAGNGREALARWRAGNYALVLTDLHMPLMDGYGLARAIRADEALEAMGARTPIIAVTANALRDEEIRCLAGGMDGYLSKPVLLTRLRAAIEAHIEPGAVPTLPMRATGQPVVELATLAALVGDDPADIAEVLQSFAASAKQSARALSAALESGGLAQAADIAHQLKGAALSIGATRLGDVCDMIEHAAPSGTDDGLKALERRLQKEMAAVLDYIDARQP